MRNDAIGIPNLLVTLSEGGIVAKPPNKTQFDAMNMQSNGESRLSKAVKSSWPLCFLLAGILFLNAGMVRAQLIDVNFNTNSLFSAGGGTTFGPAMVGAAVLGEAGDQWNEINVSSGTGIPLIYANGSNSPVTMTFTSAGGYNVYSYDGSTPFAGTPYVALMENYLYNGRLNVFAPQTITLSGLAANSTYNLVLYSAEDAAGAGRITYFTVNNNTLTNTWNGTSSTLIAGTDYVEFASALSDGSGNLAITWTGTNTAGTATGEGDINGFQIVANPARPNYITNVISTFPSGFGLSGNYASWTTATETDTGSGFQVTSSGYGSGYYALHTAFDAPGATMALLTFALNSPSGTYNFGVPFTMTDGSGNQVEMAGGPNNTAYAEISPGTYTWAAPVDGLQVSNVTDFNLEFDPTTYSGSYKITFLEIALITPVTQVTWNSPSSIAYGTALGASQLDATANVPGTFAYSPGSGTVLNAGITRIAAIFTPAETANSTNFVATNSVNLMVSPEPLTVTAANTSKVFGQSNPLFTGIITGLTNNDNITATYSCSATSSSPPGAYPIVPALVDPDNRLGNYSVTTNDGTLTIFAMATNEVMTWTNPAPITYGKALTTNQLDAAANVPGTFVYSNAVGAILNIGSVLNAGTNVLTVVFTPSDTVDYTNVTASVNLVVTPVPLTITAANASRAYGQNDPVFNGTVTGLTNGDLILLGYNCAATNISPTGTYPIVPVPVDPGHRLGNYVVTTNDGTLSVASYIAYGASVPWSTYEAENMYINGGSILGPDYGVNTVASESSGRECVQLNATGQYVEFVAQGQANSIVVRYSVPDTGSGGGANYTLSLYTNGVPAAELPVTSMYSWLYGSYPFANTPSDGSPRDFYDEVRFIGLNINPGDVIQLQKGAADTASYYDIDLVDLEEVAAPLTQPANSLSIVSYGADPSGTNDSTVALQDCISAAQTESKSVWVPSGTYQITNLINLPSAATIQGAGMWYSTFVGNAALYANSADRVTFNGNGNNIHLSDFAIVGKLNYRNDGEPNDGLGGSFGTGSSITRIWVEHTKVGAWLVNSSGLLINGCRFRDTIADGCNIDIGMKSTTVTNCTTRGTGDDCFAVWPTGYEPQNYTPGGNVFTFCTGELNFLANGGSLYGATNNLIQNCLFRDTTYGCGILISTTFSITNVVGGQMITNSFGGNTVVQNCDIVRCGGEDPGFGWRGAVQLCLQNYNITGINLLNLNITNSMSDGLDIISPGSGVSLSSTFAANVDISNYGLGVGGRQGIWAEGGTQGSMLVSNSVINGSLVTSLSVPGILDSSSPQFTFLFGTDYASSTIKTSPAGLVFSVDGTNYNTAQTFNWLSGSSHILSAPATQAYAGTPYQWYSWTDGGALAHSVTADGSADTAVFSLAAPPLAISVSGANVVIAWPTNALGFSLQYTTNLSPPVVWNSISTTPSIVKGENVLTNSLAGTRMYFRISQ